MKKNSNILILVAVFLIIGLIFAGCSPQGEKKEKAGETKQVSDKSGDKPAEMNEKDTDETADAEVKVDNGSKDGNVDIKVSGPEGETVIKGTDKDGKVDIKVSGPEGEVRIKGDKIGDTGVTNITGPKGTMKIVKDGDKGSVEIKGEDGAIKANYDKNVKESDFDVKWYPGAKVVEGLTTDKAGPAGKSMKSNVVSLESTDDIQKIKTFYVDQFTNPTIVDNSDEIVISSVDPMGGKTTVVTLQKEDGKVKIGIMSHNMNK